jgi:hypothetical protein
MISRVEQLKDIAWECRSLANAAAHAEVREQLLEVAEQFERLARWRSRARRARAAATMPPVRPQGRRNSRRAMSA